VVAVLLSGVRHVRAVIVLFDDPVAVGVFEFLDNLVEMSSMGLP